MRGNLCGKFQTPVWMLWMSLSKRFCQRCHNFVYFDQQTCASHTVCWSKSSFLAFISCKKSLHLFLNFQTKKEEKWLKIRKNVLKCQKKYINQHPKASQNTQHLQPTKALHGGLLYQLPTQIRRFIPTKLEYLICLHNK